jgi:hypothetical protein
MDVSGMLHHKERSMSALPINVLQCHPFPSVALSITLQTGIPSLALAGTQPDASVLAHAFCNIPLNPLLFPPPHAGVSLACSLPQPCSPHYNTFNLKKLHYWILYNLKHNFFLSPALQIYEVLLYHIQSLSDACRHDITVTTAVINLNYFVILFFACRMKWNFQYEALIHTK